jgi:hypothetical protein
MNNKINNLQEYFKSNKTYKTIKDSRRYWAFCWSIKKWEYKQVETFLKKIQSDKPKNKHII